MCSEIHLPTAKPAWYVDDLGSRGMPYQKMEDYLVPPESSHGMLFSPDRLKKGYHVEEIAGGVYWVTTGMYDCMFVRTGAGVIAVDAPPSLGENLLSAIEEVTDEPVTHMVYSHWPERLNGADVMTRHNMFSMIEKIRLECNHNGYVKRGNVRPPGFFF